MGNFIHDLIFAARLLRKGPGFSLVAVLALALGVGGTAVIFSVIQGVLMRTPPVPEPDRVVQVWDSMRSQNPPQDEVPVSVPGYFAYRDQTTAFEQVGAVASWQYYRTDNGPPRSTAVVYVGGDLLPIVGTTRAHLGRLIGREDERTGAQVAVISHSYWQQHFHADPEVLGRSITLSGWRLQAGWGAWSYEIVGVLPPDFQLPTVARLGRFAQYEPEVLVPVVTEPARHGFWMLTVLARLKPGVTAQQAQADLDVVAARFAQENPKTNSGYRAVLAPLDGLLARRYGLPLRLLLGAVALVYLIACLNVASLLLARSAVRGREFAIRRALGAGAGRLAAQVITESLLLTTLGGALGVLLAYAGLNTLLPLVPGEVPGLKDVRLNLAVVAFACGLALMAALLAGLPAAWQAMRPGLDEMMKSGSRGTAKGRNRALQSLVVAEFAVALMLLAAAGLLLTSFLRLTRVDPGFDPAGVVSMRTSFLWPHLSKYQKEAARSGFYRQLLENVRGLPGVEAAAAADEAPLSGRENQWEITIPGRALPPSVEKLSVDQRSVTPGYFHTMRIPLLAGRDFTEQDVEMERELQGEWLKQPGRAAPAIINQAMAQRFWPGESALGKTVFWGLLDLEKKKYDERYPLRLFTVAGIVGEVKTTGLEVSGRPQMYVPYAGGFRPITVVVRSSAALQGVAAALRNEVRRLDPVEPEVTKIETMQERFSDATGQPRFHSLLLGLFAAIAATLAAIGIYGLMSYTVGQRTHELGIRSALGARPADILRLILRQGLMLALAGTLLGLAGAMLATRWMQSLLYGVSPGDPWILSGVAFTLLLLALLACYLPGRRATRVEPTVALRAE